MKVDRFQYFVAAAKYQNLHRAAESLHISVSSIVNAVQSLEIELGVKLFLRTGRNIRLTPQGESVYESLQEVLVKFESIKASLGKQLTLSGHFRVGCPPLLFESVLLQRLLRVQKENPGLRLEICSFSSSEVQQQVLSHRLDFGFCFSPNKDAALESFVVQAGRLLPVIAKKSRVRLAKLSDLSEMPCVLPPSRTSVESCLDHPVFRKFSIHPHPKILFDSYAMAREIMLQNTHFWSLFPDCLIEKNDGLKVIRVPSTWDATYNVSCLKRKDRKSELYDLLSRAF